MPGYNRRPVDPHGWAWGCGCQGPDRHAGTGARPLQTLGIEFECIYTGWLGSSEQVDICLDYFKSYPDALAVVDPVLGDHGKPYRTSTSDQIARMSELVAVADVITPNLTEAALLLGEEYPSAPLRQQEARRLLSRLATSGHDMLVITGVDMADDHIANIGYDREQGQYWRVDCNYVPTSYPGTGDIFASVLVRGCWGATASDGN